MKRLEAPQDLLPFHFLKGIPPTKSAEAARVHHVHPFNANGRHPVLPGPTPSSILCSVPSVTNFVTFLQQPWLLTGMVLKPGHWYDGASNFAWSWASFGCTVLSYQEVCLVIGPAETVWAGWLSKGRMIIKALSYKRLPTWATATTLQPTPAALPSASRIPTQLFNQGFNTFSSPKKLIALGSYSAVTPRMKASGSGRRC